MNTLFNKLRKQNIRSVSVSESTLEGNDIDLILNFNNTNKALALAMPLDDAIDLCKEMFDVIERVRNEKILQSDASDA